MAIVVVPKYHRLGEGFSRREQLKALEHPGRNTRAKGYQSPASWICDLADNKNAILLCRWCATKFNPRKNKYRKRFVVDMTMKTDGWVANGKCDACKQDTALMGGGTVYVSEETWRLVSMDPLEARKLARQRRQYAMDSWKQQEIIADYRANPEKYGKRKVTIPVTDKRRFK